MNFKTTVKQELDKQGKSQKWLSEEMGLTKSTVHNIVKKPGYITIQRIGKILGKEYLKIFIE